MTRRSEQTDNATLFDRIGGERAIAAVVPLFYEKVLADEVTRPFFEGVDMARQAAKLVSMLAWALGGGTTYTGKDLRAAHAHLVRSRGLGDVHFDHVAQHLGATLLEAGVDQAERDEIMAIVGSARDQVLGR